MDMLADNLYLLLVAVLLITLIAGFPVAFTLTGVSL